MITINLLSKRCPKCKRIKSLKHFKLNFKHRFNKCCKPCCQMHAKYMFGNKEEYYRKHKERMKAKRIDTINHYGGKCACCGESQIEFLAFDHTEGNGNEHRREIGVSNSSDILLWLIRNNYPEGFRVLCHNCNSAHGYYGYCPHKGQPQRDVGYQDRIDKLVAMYAERRLLGAKRLPAHNKGVPCSEEMKERIATKLTGGRLSAETKAKLKISQAKRWANTSKEDRLARNAKIKASWHKRLAKAATA